MLDQLTTTNDWDFPIRKEPVHDERGAIIPGSFGIFREDTHECMGVHGSSYKPLTHTDAVTRVMEAMDNVDFSRDFDTKFEAIDGGRKLRAEIIFPNITRKNPAIGDITQFRISTLNSYDGSWAFESRTDALCLWCLNGAVHSETSSRSKMKHTLNANLNGISAKIQLGLDAFWKQDSQWKEWLMIQVTDDMAETFFRNTLAKAYTPQKQVVKTNNKQLDRLLIQWREEVRMYGHNKWALYNAMTHWSTHTEDYSKQPSITRKNNEDKLINVLGSNKWLELN